MRRPHEPDFALFALLPAQDGLFLDVGANSGQSALSFRLFNRHSDILSVEPLRLIEPDLRLVRRILRGFDYLICGAGDRNAEMTLHVPVYRGTPLTGQASLRRQNAENCHWLSANLDSPPSASVEIAEVPIRVRRLDDLGLAPAYVKIDVEGMVLEVIRGLGDTVTQHQPLLLVETPENLAEVLALEALSGYRPFVFVPDSGLLAHYDGRPAANLFLLPAGFDLTHLMERDAARHPEPASS